MLKNPDFNTAREVLLRTVEPVSAEAVALACCGGRVLAEDLSAAENVPSFDRSPYDGYAFRSADTAGASKASPVTLQIIEEVPAGAVPARACTEGAAVKLLTGAPIPEGADAVIKYEATEFTAHTVRIFSPVRSGENIIRTGEDVRRGDILIRRGQRIDPGAAGTLAAQGLSHVRVYRMPRVGIISTGDEVVEAGEERSPGKIYNSNRFTLAAALEALGCEAVYLGLAGDSVSGICRLLKQGLRECDAVVATGGVSAGDYDRTPEAMELAGVRLLFRGVDIKPGMACAYGEKDGRLICGLSGNPASALTNFYVLAAPALKKLAGLADVIPEVFPVKLNNGFRKGSPHTRLLRGTLTLSGGTAGMLLPPDQGNGVLSSAIGCDVIAIVPAGSGPLDAGTVLEGFLL